MKEKKIHLELEGVEAKIIYHTYEGFDLNTLLVSFDEKRRVLSTLDGFKRVKFVANNYTPLRLSERTMMNYNAFKRKLPRALGINPRHIAFMSTGVNMDNAAVREKSYEEFKVYCLATAGAKGNALRTGVDTASYVERDGKFFSTLGTINLILLTNANLSNGAMARAIITATEAKTAALQDLNVRSTSAPQHQATGTGTDNVIVVSGRMGRPLLASSGHVKIGELIGHATKAAVTEALKRHDGL
ncbi:adenosylcobinamide amidohydrolase [Candidatus Bathyarchaeota archaeon A05DMB-2]|jgi:adenosylcobinamide amidohydrolase|nr:adenosylcobinamide amidohydrolase [Candidatus Bathyarchaeota archaeon A05DMB-2]